MIIDWNRRIKRIGIDIDSTSTQRLLMTWLMGKKFFPDSKIEVRLSSSHTGFHVLIERPCSLEENIMWRSALWDDPVRLEISLRRIFMSDDGNPDILFDLHSKGKAERIPFEKILKPYKDKINKILEEWDGKMNEEVVKIAEEIEGKIEKKDVWMTMFAFKDAPSVDIEGNKTTLKEKIKEVCQDCAVKDPSFRYRIYQSFMPDEYDYLLALFSGNRDQSFQRGEWFLPHKDKKGRKKGVFTKDDLKNVKSFKCKEKTMYYWIKKKK